MGVIINNPYFLATGLLSVVNLLLLAILGWQFRKYQKRQNELLAGEETGDLAEIVLKHKKTLAIHNKNLKELGQILEELVTNNKLNIQKIGFVRFNPFADAGGNISFALALLDGLDCGIVISSLHSREGTRIYAKNVSRGQSEYHLTGEEKEAISNANKKLPFDPAKGRASKLRA